MKNLSLIISSIIWVVACQSPKEQKMTSINKRVFGTLESGQEVHEYTLTNASGASVSIINFGCIVTSIQVHDKNGDLGEVVLGFDELAQYQKKASVGALIGRFANRIANAKFELNGNTYELEANNGPNNLHSGTQSWNREVWEVIKEVENSDTLGITLKLVSPHMDDGFPGEVTCTVKYLWTNENELIIDYQATADRTTHINLTNHSYFNLNDPQVPITDHSLSLKASAILPVSEVLIPTGDYLPVEGTPFDFRTEKAVGLDIDQDHPQLNIAKGYDHCWVIDDWDNELKEIAILFDPVSGREMITLTNEPGVQIYTANGLSGKGRANEEFVSRGAICLETQHFPDSPNQPDFPSTILEPEDQFKSQTIYKFSVR